MGFWVADDNAQDHEHEAIEHLESRLHGKFPTVPDDLIDRTVDSHYHELDANPIREYVPVLVEHATVKDLWPLTHAGRQRSARRTGWCDIWRDHEEWS